MKRYMLAIMLCLCLIMSSCDDGRKPIYTRYSNVARVFYHARTDYSFLVLDEKTRELINPVATLNTSIEGHVYADLAADEPMWAEVSDFIPGVGHRINIHIHSVAHVSGGGWNRGKGGRGQTSIIE